MEKQSNLALVVESRRFQWNEIRSRACVLLAEGYKVSHVARECGVSVRTIERFMAHPEFAHEVDKVTMMTGIALASERMRIIKRAVNQAIASDGTIKTKRDIFEWLKLATDELDRSKLFLNAMFKSVLDDAMSQRTLSIDDDSADAAFEEQPEDTAHDE
jgi:hypothetical protein